MRQLILLIFISVLIGLFALDFQAQTSQTKQTPPAAQTPPYPPQAQTAPAKPAIDAGKLAEDWIVRLNALDKWYLSLDGKEVGREEPVNRMMELYAPDAIAEVPPHDEDQIGPVMLRGSANIRKWVDRISQTQVRLLYIQKRQTQKQFEGEKLIYTTPLPWGGMGISFEIIAAYSRRQDRRKFTAPGAVFLQFGTDGKIQRLRLYLAETSEVVAL